ncbi:membrane protein [Candidatus Magnetobacterium bavaricum]|uniref:Membrane protein n=1 Tax=Candidatus Magnetobacterium bavaricum TaxID=29290 RepID=A0A0F3GWA9_9BACT|nr:membrane protein [Candidatus Magnetobacterium bavaricum]
MTARCCSASGLAVPISIPLYTCIESALIISVSRYCAINMATLLLPTQVGPTSATTVFWLTVSIVFCNDPLKCILHLTASSD